MKIKVLILVFLIIVSGFSENNKRGVRFLIKKLNKEAQVGKQYLVIIAINKYKKWLPLINPVKDAKKLKEIIKVI